MLMYPLGAQSVKCSVCHYVTHVSQQANWGGSGSAGQQQAAQPKTQTVVVENPPSLDEHGNEVCNTWAGCCMQVARRRLSTAAAFGALQAVGSARCSANPSEQPAICNNTRCLRCCSAVFVCCAEPCNWCCCCVACRWRTSLLQ